MTCGGHSVTTRSYSVFSRARARRRRGCCALAQLLQCTTPRSACGVQVVFRRRGDVVVVLLDGLGIIGALLVGGGLGGEVLRAPAFGLAL